MPSTHGAYRLSGGREVERRRVRVRREVAQGTGRLDQQLGPNGRDGRGGVHHHALLVDLGMVSQGVGQFLRPVHGAVAVGGQVVGLAAIGRRAGHLERDAAGRND